MWVDTIGSNSLLNSDHVVSIRKVPGFDKSNLIATDILGNEYKLCVSESTKQMEDNYSKYRRLLNND